ncbi:MAG TPA: hypothetical protein VKF61_06480 [Candidatus Polarisedimenticolia bacterium]|nr:hypothetical protein [Candidatus Polarisedimenticolia bacterium]
MPAALERCVQHVLSRPDFAPQEGRTAEESAYAICTTSTGLSDDLSDDEIKMRVDNEIARQKFGGTTPYRKRMVIANPLGRFINGAQEGKMTVDRLKALAQNFKKYPRQVPIFLMGDHDFNLERPPDGWVEEAKVNRDGQLEIESKLHGEAVRWVLNDLVRGASIGTIKGKNYKGEEIGEVLQHVLLTNNPFDKGTKVSVSQLKGAPLLYFTALDKEAAMAEKETPEKPDVEPNPPTNEDIKQRDEEIVRLKAENLELKDRLDNATVDEEKHELALRVATLEEKTLAQEIREVVFNMLRQGQIKPAWADGYAKGGNAGTISWFKASRFKGNLELLKWAAENNPPLYRTGQAFTPGIPKDNAATSLTEDDKELLRKHGISPELHASLREAGSAQERFKAYEAAAAAQKAQEK